MPQTHENIAKTFSFKALSTEGLAEGEFAGYASAFNVVDDDGDLIRRGAFAKCLPDFIENGFIAWQHDWHTPIGKPMECYEDNKGLFIRAKVSDTEKGRDAMTLIKDEVVRKMSIGFRTGAYAMLSEDQGRQILGDEYDEAVKKLPWYREQVREITEVAKLYEVSAVSVPANTGADILGAKNAGVRLSYAEHSQAVESAVQEFLQRTKAHAQLRQSNDRPISQEKQKSLLSLIELFEGNATELRGVLNALQPQGEALAKASDDEVLAVMAEAAVKNARRLLARSL